MNCELLFNKINLKLEILKKIDHEKHFHEKIDNLKNEISMISPEFIITEDMDAYIDYLKECNFEGKCSNFIRKMKKKYEISVRQNTFYKKYCSLRILKRSYKKEKIDFCKTCEVKMSLNVNSSCYICEKCGEQVMVSVEVKNSKKGSSKEDPAKNHLEKWFRLIQGKGEVKYVKPEHKEIIKNIIVDLCKYNGVFKKSILGSINSDTIRERLKSINLTSYYNKINIIRRNLTEELGNEIFPPQLTFEEERAIIKTWNKISKDFNIFYSESKINKRKNARNSIYYPYLIIYIFNVLYPEDKRLPKLKDCIHRQSHESIKIKNMTWKKICDKYNFIYNPIF